SAPKVWRSPSWSTSTSVTAVPEGLVPKRTAVALVSNVTFGYCSAGRPPRTSASDLAWSGQGKPSQKAQRTHVLYGMFASSSITPHGAWKGWEPAARGSAGSCWIRGSCDSAGKGYGALAEGSVGSSPRAPCTW